MQGLGERKREIQRSKRGAGGRKGERDDGYRDEEGKSGRARTRGTAFTAFHWTAVSNGHNAGPAFFT